MKAAIEQALSVLLGLPLWDSGRAADLQWFHFGDRREVTDVRGRARIVGAYALHVQCAWHLAGPAGIVVASDDRYVAAGDAPFDRGDDRAWDRPGANRCDARMTAFFASRAAPPPVVAAFAGDNVGGMRLSLTDDLVLAVFPADSLGGEHWRLFQPGRTGDHFVVTGAGIEN